MQTLFWADVILVGILTLAAYSPASETLLGATIENIGKFLGGAGLVILVVIFASQCFEWLRFGTWPTHPPLSEGFAKLGIELPQTTWVGGQRIIDWLMSEPIGLVVFFLAAILGWILKALGEQIRQDALRTPRSGKEVLVIPAGFLYLVGGLWAISAIGDENLRGALSIVWLLGGVAGFVALRRARRLSLDRSNESSVTTGKLNREVSND